VSWRNSRGELSEIEDVHFKCTGFNEYAKEHKFIISDLDIGKAHIFLVTTSVQTSSSSSSYKTEAHGNTDNDLKLFRIDRIHLNDIYLKDSGTGFELSMPNLDYTGFKVEDGKIDLGSLEIKSDRLDFHTEPGGTLTLEGKSVDFQKHFTGVLKPPLSKSIKQPIDFVFDIGLTDAKKIYYHFTGFDKGLEIFVDKEQMGYIHARDLRLASYLTFPPYDLPTKATFDGSVPTNIESVGAEIPPPTGDVTMGVTDFKFDPGKIPVVQENGGYLYEIKATNRAGNADLIATLKMQSKEPRARLAFSSKPEMPPREIISKVFFGRNFSELDPSEQKQVEEKMPLYSSP
jgi:hypothetical protein